MTTFLSLNQPVITGISTHKYENGTTRSAVTEFRDINHERYALTIDDPGIARELLTAAYQALHILDPDAAADALADLLDQDALTVIRRRVAEVEARNGSAAATAHTGGAA